MLKRALIIRPQFAKLNAFLTSSVTTAQYSLVPNRHLSPSIASLAMSTTLLIASIVDRPFLNPYCRSERVPPASAHDSSRLYIILSSIFPIVSSRQMGPYDDFSPGGLPGFGMRTNFCFFHLRGKTPSTKHWRNTLANVSGLRWIAALSALFGIPSGPVVFLSPIPVHAASTSSPVTSGMVWMASGYLLIKM